MLFEINFAQSAPFPKSGHIASFLGNQTYLYLRSSVLGFNANHHIVAYVGLGGWEPLTESAARVTSFSS